MEHKYSSWITIRLKKELAVIITLEFTVYIRQPILWGDLQERLHLFSLRICIRQLNRYAIAFPALDKQHPVTIHLHAPMN